MKDKKTIAIGALSAIVVSLLILGANVDISGGNVYYCEDRLLVMECDSLSQYYGLDNGKCNNAELGNKVCSTGWLLIVDDIPVPEPTINESDKKDELYAEWLEGVQEGIKKRQHRIDGLVELKDWLEATDDFKNECIQRAVNDCEDIEEMEIFGAEAEIDSLETEIENLEKEIIEKEPVVIGR